jgi:plasmid maintenance system antidote protein VapI
VPGKAVDAVSNRRKLRQGNGGKLTRDWAAWTPGVVVTGCRRLLERRCPGQADQRDRHNRRRITADVALHLTGNFAGTPHRQTDQLSWNLGTDGDRFWVNIQTHYDLGIGKGRLGAALDSIRPLSAAS